MIVGISSLVTDDIAGAAAGAICLRIPAGSRLKTASGRNQTLGGQRIGIYLATGSLPDYSILTTTGLQGLIPLKQEIQAGTLDFVIWNGDLEIHPAFANLLIVFYAPGTASVLEAQCGVEN